MAAHLLQFDASDLQSSCRARRGREHHLPLRINTILIQRTIDRKGLWLQPEDCRALTPLFFGHIENYGLVAPEKFDIARNGQTSPSVFGPSYRRRF
jgi:hypothetical protein